MVDERVNYWFSPPFGSYFSEHDTIIVEDSEGVPVCEFGAVTQIPLGDEEAQRKEVWAWKHFAEWLVERMNHGN